MAYVYVPIVQRELDDFREIVWNNSRGRKQPLKALPTGVPAHMHAFPETYGYQNYGIAVVENDFSDLAAVDSLKDIFEGNVEDYIPRTFSNICDELLARIDVYYMSAVEINDAIGTYLYLREEISKIN